MTARTQMPEQTRLRRIAAIVALIIAGEAVFGLAFVVPRVFRSTMLELFGVSNTELGLAFSLYGLVAMVSYFLGGPLADRFSARLLMVIGLVATALGGVVLTLEPSFSMLRGLYAWWGASTVLLFWSPLIRATREWGGLGSQGRAYGLLDGGRGLFAALVGSLTVLLFGLLMPETSAEVSAIERGRAFDAVIWVFTGCTLGAALLVWLCVPDRGPQDEHGAALSETAPGLSLAGVVACIRIPAVWLQALIIICAYVGYKSCDDFAVYARDAFGCDEVTAASMGTISLWVRPPAAVLAGLLADRLRPSVVSIGCFALMAVGSLCLALGVLADVGELALFAWIIVATCGGIHGLRGVYFALFGEARVPWAYTGSAVGLVSVLGYTPDIFAGPMMGALVDSAPGARGHEFFFWVVAGFAFVGMLASLATLRVTRSLQL